jgi:glycosyltransferase involved in cell wall biosynthesis
MNITIIDTTLTTPPTGGAQTFLVELCASLKKRAWGVSVVTQPGPAQEIVAALQSAGAEVHQNIWRAVDLPEERAARLAAWVNSRSPDVYVVSISPDAGWLALPLLDSGIATVTIAHNDVSAFYEPLKHYHPLVDCAVGVSAETHRKIVEHCHIPAARARQIAYGVHSIAIDEMESRCAASSDARNPLRVGYVGRLVQLQKRVFDLVPLAEELKVRGADFELHIIGDGPESAALTGEFERRGLSEVVKFHGWLSSAEVRKHLLTLDVFVLLSDYEGLPVALLEAMGHALATVVTRIESGNTELVVDGENGFVVPVGDVGLATRRLKQLADDRSALAAMKRAAWMKSRQFSVEAMVENYIECFSHVTNSEFAREHRRSAPHPYPLMQSCVSRYPTWLRKIKARLLELTSTDRASVS